MRIKPPKVDKPITPYNILRPIFFFLSKSLGFFHHEKLEFLFVIDLLMDPSYNFPPVMENESEFHPFLPLDLSFQALDKIRLIDQNDSRNLKRTALLPFDTLELVPSLLNF